MNLLSYLFEGNSKAAIVCQTELREQDVLFRSGPDWSAGILPAKRAQHAQLSLLPMFALRAQAGRMPALRLTLLTAELESTLVGRV